MRVMIVVTHLLGTGHLARALTLSRAFAEAGHRVVVVSGGLPVPHLDHNGVELVQLPPLCAHGTDFTNLRSADGEIASEAYRTTRQQHLLRACTDWQPDVLITELFPFGRRNLRAEFLALLEANRDALVLASIRDILAPPSKPSKAEWADDIVTRHYHGVLVHSDPRAIPLDQSWPVTPQLAEKLHYTGFVAPPLPEPAGEGSGEILVTAGGGNVGETLFRAAVQAATSDPRRWRLLIGSDPEAIIARLPAPPPNVVMEPARPDFRALLQNAAASVSLCGYNTAMDMLQTARPAVFVPFDAGGEVEQTLRAKALSHLPGLCSLPARDLTPGSLLAAIKAVQAAPPRQVPFSFDGAGESVRIVESIRQTLS